MDKPLLFDACIPVLERYLASLESVLVAVETGPAPSETVLNARLADDMLPFYKQVQTAAFFALRTALPLAGQPLPAFVEDGPDLQALLARVAHTLQVIRSVGPEAFAGAADRAIAETAGEVPVKLPAQEFLCQFALPNFFFHLSMAYAIARASGCALGKPAYDGYHVYRAEA